MKKITLLLAITFLVAGFVSCSRKSRSTSGENLNPVNAPQKYGEVMGKAYQKAKAMNAILPLKQLIEAFYVKENRYPSSLQELKDKGYTKELPQPPAGTRFNYDPATGFLKLENL